MVIFVTMIMIMTMSVILKCSISIAQVLSQGTQMNERDRRLFKTNQSVTYHSEPTVSHNMMGEKFCLKWDDFQENLLASFEELRSDNDFTDVTLACEDQSVKVHKVILSACSPFFKKMLKTHSHPQPLIYMRGIKASELVALMDFIYQGEANVYQDQLERFLALAQELELKGLSERGGEEAPELSKYLSEQNVSVNQNPWRNNLNVLSNVKHEGQANEGKAATIQTDSKHTLSKTAYIDMMERRIDGLYACNNCGYTSRQKCHMQEHVEKHIEGLEYPCNSCNKIMRSSQSLRNHKRKTMKCTVIMNKKLKSI